uniref:Dazl n=1 Tax=Odontobutis potamophilus TaxID=3358257 RepID=A0A2Z4EVR1_9GOBI|nr:dazl [Odontobutis potamophila]
MEDNDNPRSSAHTSSSLRSSNGYIPPEGQVTPNAIFVSGIGIAKVDENEIRDLFAQFGAVREVKVITNRRGICKGYGFIYFNEDVNVQSIIDQQISFNGRKLKFGPAILKGRSARSMPSHLIDPAPKMSPRQYFYCTCGLPMDGSLAQPAPVLSGGGPYSQQYPYSGFGGLMVPQMLVNYSQNTFAYQDTPPYWTPDQRTQPANQIYFLPQPAPL